MTTGPRARRGPVPIAEIISVVSRDLGKESSEREKIASFWQKLVGKKKSLHTKIAAFENGTLTILVDSSSILYELALEKEAFLGELQKEFGKESLKEIRVFYGTGS